MNKKIEILLPRPCTGLDVADYFKKIAPIHESKESRWELNVYYEDYRYEPSSAKPIPLSVRIYISPLVLKKRWKLFGKKIWEYDYESFNFKFDDLRLRDQYSEIHADLIDRRGMPVSEPWSYMNKRLRKILDEVVENLYELIEKKESK